MDSNVAVIMGGSIAGLLSAKALSPYFSKIIILDRDQLFDTEIPRKGTAQAYHAHVLLKRGLNGLDNLLPGFIDKLKQAGAISTNANNDWQSFFPVGFLKRYISDIHTLCQSRHLLETTLRQYVMEKTPNLEIVEKADVTQVKLHTNQKPEVTYNLDGETHTLSPELLVDCSGRYSKSPLYLKQSGFGEVPRKEIYPYLGYATRVFKNVTLKDGYLAALVIPKDPDLKRGGIVMPIENGQHVVTIFAFSKDYPGKTEEEFLEYAKSLRGPMVYDAIKDAEPVTAVKQYVKKESHFNEYDKLHQWPQGYVILGDAITSFNPIYGQGITSAVMSAEILADEFKLAKALENIDLKSVQHKICESCKVPWHISQNEDLRWPMTEGAKANWLLKQMHKFSHRVATAATVNQDVAYAYTSVLHMLNRPTVLFKPKTLYKIFKYGNKKTNGKYLQENANTKPNPL